MKTLASVVILGIRVAMDLNSNRQLSSLFNQPVICSLAHPILKLDN
jgi:hypothetical protein